MSRWSCADAVEDACRETALATVIEMAGKWVARDVRTCPTRYACAHLLGTSSSVVSTHTFSRVGAVAEQLSCIGHTYPCGMAICELHGFLSEYSVLSKLQLQCDIE